MKNSIAQLLHIIILIPILLMHTNCYFMDLTGLLNPIMNPRNNIVINNNINVNLNNYDNFNNGRFNRDKRGYNFNINHENGNGNKGRGRNKKVEVSENLRKQLDTEQDLYQAMGIPQNILYNYILPIHMEARRNLYRYFPFHHIQKKQLMLSMMNLREMIQWITKTYLNQINCIVLGSDNLLVGQHVYVNGDHQTVMGVNDFVFNGNFPQNAIKGANIVRIGSFDVDLDLVQKIKRKPEDCITFLGLE